MPRSSSSSPRSIRRENGSRRWCFIADRRVGNYPFRICGEEPGFLPLLDAIYPNSGWRVHARAVREYRLTREPGGMVAAYASRRLLKRASHASRLLVPLEWWITYDILGARSRNLHLHGGGFRGRDGVVLLPGAHGSGKTSLTLEALYRGYQVYSDEILVVDPRKMLLRPHPRCFVVKEGGMELFPHLRGLVRTRAPQKVGRTTMVWYVNPREIEPGYLAPAAPPRHLVFPQFREGAVTRMTPISEMEAVGRLLSCVFTFFMNPGAALTGIAGLARSCRSYQLTFGDLRQGFDAMEAILADRRAA